jgi:hypothetical protein
MEWDAHRNCQSFDGRKGGPFQPDRKTFVDRVGIGALFHYHAQ